MTLIRHTIIMRVALVALALSQLTALRAQDSDIALSGAESLLFLPQVTR